MGPPCPIHGSVNSFSNQELRDFNVEGLHFARKHYLETHPIAVEENDYSVNGDSCRRWKSGQTNTQEESKTPTTLLAFHHRMTLFYV